MALSYHPIANIFPLIEGAEFEQLVFDVKAHGVREAIWIYEGRILDGRNRYRAAEVAGVKCPTREYLGNDPIAFVVSLNLRRRDLTMSQRAMAALEIERLEAEFAKKRMAAGGGDKRTGTAKLPDPVLDQGESREKAGAQVGVSARYVGDAKYIANNSPDKAEEIKKGKKTISQAMREIKREKLAEKTPPAPTGKYRVIYADPPWKYNDTLSISRDGLGESYGPAEAHYPPMTISELCSLPVADLAEENAVLFLWTTSPLLEDTFRIVNAWGFKYKSSFIWDKVKHNMGHYNSVRHEFLLICTRGSCTPDVAKLFDSVQSIERTDKHSQKPEEFREIIDTIYPNGTRIELFARGDIPATWARWGNEANAA